MHVDCLGVFAKHWTPGKVKTRLAATIGDVAAAKVHQALLRATLLRLGRVDGEHIDRVLVVDSPESVPAMRRFAPSPWRIEVQASGDLGARMRAFFDAQFALGRRRTVLLGSDSPNIPLQIVERAFAGLREADVALGPTADGGYYLVGAAHRTPPIFTDMPWSSDRLYRCTLDALEQRGDRCCELPEWYDVDDIDDLHRLQGDTAAAGDADADLVQLGREVQEIIG